MKKILVVFGTRPEAIKMAPLVKKLQNENSLRTKVCVTAQHREMLDQVLNFFKIVPDFDLNLMQQNQTLNQLSGRIFTEIDIVLNNFKPDIVLVHGDTTTSSIVAMASFYREIKVGHIEAGLRTYNKKSPFPEEINRQITGRVADLHFAPTLASANNLRSENVSEDAIFITGNTVIDALFWGLKNIDEGNVEIKKLKNIINTTKKLIVVTGHRRESFGKKFQSFCEALKELSQRDDVQIIYPVHLNPNVQKTVHKILENNTNVHLIAPLNYEAFIWLLNKSYLIITDSGGIQEEAPSLKKPVLVTRNVTERQEAVESGAVKLVGTSKVEIVNEAVMLLENKIEYTKMISNENPYGNGKSATKIVEILKSL